MNNANEAYSLIFAIIAAGNVGMVLWWNYNPIVAVNGFFGVLVFWLSMWHLFKGFESPL